MVQFAVARAKVASSLATSTDLLIRTTTATARFSRASNASTHLSSLHHLSLL